MAVVKVKVINPLFKNGQTIEAGENTSLEINTALRFQEAGDVEILDKILVETHEVRTASLVE